MSHPSSPDQPGSGGDGLEALNQLDHHEATSESLRIIESTSFIESARPAPTWPASTTARS